MADSVGSADEDLYRQIKQDLLSKGMEGKFVLIKDGKLVEVYDDYAEAYNAAAAQLQPPFLIKQVFRVEQVETI
jgi:hypothetical protein